MNKRNIKISDNGTLGEALARAFLLERFWVLERSIDIHGVDFLIQRRITNINILDQSPPRFGAIQVKFSQECKTNHKVFKCYAIDKNDVPYSNFYVLVFARDRKTNNIYKFLISSRDLKDSFEIYNSDNGEYFQISTKSLLQNDLFRVSNNHEALSKMERAIADSEWAQNLLLLNRFVTYGDVVDVVFKNNGEPISEHDEESFEYLKDDIMDLIGLLSDCQDYLVDNVLKSDNPTEILTCLRKLFENEPSFFGFETGINETDYEALCEKFLHEK